MIERIDPHHPPLSPDAEGVVIAWQGRGHSRLVVANQGESTLAVYERTAP